MEYKIFKSTDTYVSKFVFEGKDIAVDSLYNFVFLDGTSIKRRGVWLMTFNKNGISKTSSNRIYLTKNKLCIK